MVLPIYDPPPSSPPAPGVGIWHLTNGEVRHVKAARPPSGSREPDRLTIGIIGGVLGDEKGWIK